MVEARPPSYIPSLDGIRALSIGVVFVAHAGADHVVPGGFGVTVFFFLSGFLITTLLRRERSRTGRIDFRNFYIRRSLRIFPPMYLALAASAVLSGLGWLPHPATAEGIAFQALHLSNYYSIFEGGSGIASGMGIMWSLAVEEHFYLTFPWLCLPLLRLGRAGRLLVLVALCAAVLLWRVYLVSEGADPARTYMATDTRFDSILFGCLLALCFNPVLDPPIEGRAEWELLVLAASGALLVFCFLYRDPVFRETYRYSLQGIALAPAFYLAVRRHRWPLFAWLETTPMKWLGLTSYVMYLCHHVIIYLLGHQLPGVPVAARGALAFALTLAVSSATYWWVEKPLARMRHRFHAPARARAEA